MDTMLWQEKAGARYNGMYYVPSLAWLLVPILPPALLAPIGISRTHRKRGLAMMHCTALQGFRAFLSCVVILEPSLLT